MDNSPHPPEDRPAYPIAGLDRRFAAFALDRCIGLLVVGLTGLAGWQFLAGDGRVWTAVSATAGVAVVLWVLLAVLAGAAGTSPGKAAFGLRLVGADTGTPIGTGRALTRAAILTVAGVPTLGLGVAMLAWTALSDAGGRRRGLHDAVAGSVVVDLHQQPDEAEAAEEPVPQHVVNLTAMRLMPAPTPGTAQPGPGQPGTVGVAGSSALGGHTPTGGGTSSGTDPAVAARAASADPGTGPAPATPSGPSTATPSGPAAGSHRAEPEAGPAAGQRSRGGRRLRLVPPPGEGTDAPTSDQDRSRAQTPAWTLSFGSGEEIRIDGLMLVGRNPEGRPGEDVQHLVALSSSDMSVSKTHAQVHLAPGNTLVVMDRGSTNGSVLVRQGISRDLHAGRPATLVDGDRVVFGDCEMRVRRD